MLLKVPQLHSRFSETITVKRDRETRESWVSFYDGGGRLFRLTLSNGTRYAILKQRPEVSKGSITFNIGLFLIAEVWGGKDGQLCSVFVKLNNVVYHGRAINGWAFKPHPDPMQFPVVEPSVAAQEIALNFLSKHSDIMVKDSNKYEPQHADNTAINAKPDPRADKPGGATEDAGLRLPI